MKLLRPTLIPGLSRVWRGPRTLQLGLDPALAVLIDLPDARTARLLDLLDGTRSERAALTEAKSAGVPLHDARDLLTTLHAAGLVRPAPALLPPSLAATTHRRLTGEAAALALSQAAAARPFSPLPKVPPDHPTPAQILRRRAGAQVIVAGHGRLGAGIAVALAEAGVRHVHPALTGPVTLAELAGSPLRATEAGEPRAEAVAAAIVRAAPETQTHPVRRKAATLIIQLGHDEPVPLLAARHRIRRQPHLAVTIREGVAVVGPFVPASGSPCMNCIELHRLDRDAAWPSVAIDPHAPEPCGVATILAATAYVTAEALAVLDGRTPDTLGAAVEIAAPGTARRRTWPPHRACPCLKPGRRPTASRPPCPGS